MVVTAEGRIGVVPLSVKVGEPIYVLQGGDVSFVFRLVKQGTWSLIGHCYIHGIMDGQSFDVSKLNSMVLV
jgi:hypothetical protein